MVLFDSEKEFREYAPGESTAGLYQSGLERDYIVTYAGGELPRVVTHEFVHFLLNQTPAPLPRWFEEGTAELYSNTQINNKRVRIGKEIESHTNLLLAPAVAQRQPTDWRNGRRRLDSDDQEQAENMFYAESWALVHMLNLSPNYRDHMPQFAMLLANGTDGSEAFRMAFGRDFARAVADLPAYLKKIRSVQTWNRATPAVCGRKSRAGIGSRGSAVARRCRPAPRAGGKGSRLVRAGRAGTSRFGHGASGAGNARHDPESSGRCPPVSGKSHPAR